MAATAVYKKGDTTRIPAQVILGGGPLPLGGKSVKVKLAASDIAEIVVTLTTSGGGVEITSAGTGSFNWVVTAADLAALGDPEQVWTVINVWNADDTLAFTAAGYVSVEL